MLGFLPLLLAPALAAQTPAAARALDTPGMRWETRATPRARTHALVGTTASRRADSIAAESERTIGAHLAWLGADRLDDTLHLFFVGSRDQMGPPDAYLTGPIGRTPAHAGREDRSPCGSRRRHPMRTVGQLRSATRLPGVKVRAIRRSRIRETL